MHESRPMNVRRDVSNHCLVKCVVSLRVQDLAHSSCCNAKEWDAAVRKATVQSGACSLACVFLTDKDSGLGVHQDMPGKEGHCWCEMLYGQVIPARLTMYWAGGPQEMVPYVAVFLRKPQTRKCIGGPPK